MEKAKVYFTDFRATFTENLLQKLARLMATAGMDNLPFDGKYVAIKLHFGEPGNLAFLRPNYAKAVADFVRSCGGKPFLTDCNTLYVGGRKNALDHLDTAALNGFGPATTGCHVLIADGLKGTDDVVVPIRGGKYLQEARIGRAIMDADIVVSLTHFKGHELTGIGGAIKNLGMGSGSRAGKMAMHSAGKPWVDESLCIGCGSCADVCAHGAPVLTDGTSHIDHDRCVGCGRCIGVCPVDAVLHANDEANDILNAKMAECAKAVLDGRPSFHIALVNSVSPNCDCHSENDAPIVPDVGMFASLDPVALDRACTDAVNAQPRLPGTWIDESGDGSIADTMTAAHPDTNWHSQLDHAEAIGLGTQQYELIRI